MNSLNSIHANLTRVTVTNILKTSSGIYVSGYYGSTSNPLTLYNQNDSTFKTFAYTAGIQ